MRKTFLATLLLAVLTLQAQITVMVNGPTKNVEKDIDRQRYVIGYNMTFVADSLKPEPQNEQMQLEIGDRCTKFYSNERMQKDSIMRARIQQGNYDFTDLKGGNIRWTFFKGYPAEGKSAWLESVGTNDFIAIDPVTTPEWHLVGDSVTRILDYECRQATARFKGRTWTVWYTEDIPIAEGPWLLGGLPGLVMRARDARGHYAFEINGLKQVKDGRPVTFTEAKREEISFDTFRKEMRRFCDDAIAYMKNDPRVTVTVTDKDGNPMEKMTAPYNPLDLE